MASVTYSNFREACDKRGLTEMDKSIDDCLIEATTFQMSCALRRLFATILVFCEATNILGLWDKHKDALGEDFRWDYYGHACIKETIDEDRNSYRRGDHC